MKNFIEIKVESLSKARVKIIKQANILKEGGGCYE